MYSGHAVVSVRDIAENAQPWFLPSGSLQSHHTTTSTSTEVLACYFPYITRRNAKTAHRDLSSQLCLSFFNVLLDLVSVTDFSKIRIHAS